MKEIIKKAFIFNHGLYALKTDQTNRVYYQITTMNIH